MNATRSVLVTGASSGLGRHAAADLAKAGWHVVLGCRDVQRGADAAAWIRGRHPDASLEVLEMDLASLASVRSAAPRLASADRPPLHAVVCNAGVQVVDGIRRSADGHELTFATNHLGHFLLVRLLLDHIAEPGRVVFVASNTHLGPEHSYGFPGPVWADPIRLADPERSPVDGSPKGGRQRYATSKLANVYTTYELARRLGERRITANAFDPGLMPQTGLSRDYPPLLRRIYLALAPVMIRLLSRAYSVEDAASALAWLVDSPEPAEVTGGYFVLRRQQPSSPESYDQERAAELWRASEELTGVRV
ncbi:SDR family NAD(P)-dependent oxidoreductase [Thermobifida halotolerans]|uniref:SDR family NAD(P)-dependent oxidoreductase n=1 Tax=Thermobifida halotolerans TaxID=483545 RepID=A0A399G3J8_9ACTN|nr:SDR family NAD(P)-dependent oxidoreductase [Thermobifida halotolerans]UOE18391.1 SDR family NAD(P)-dependent oxidoreductase [Thermobifida halotolerans]